MQNSYVLSCALKLSTTQNIVDVVYQHDENEFSILVKKARLLIIPAIRSAPLHMSLLYTRAENRCSLCSIIVIVIHAQGEVYPSSPRWWERCLSERWKTAVKRQSSDFFIAQFSVRNACIPIYVNICDFWGLKTKIFTFDSKNCVPGSGEVPTDFGQLTPSPPNFVHVWLLPIIKYLSSN